MERAAGATLLVLLIIWAVYLIVDGVCLICEGITRAHVGRWRREVRMPRKYVEHRAASTERTWIGGTDEAWVALRLLGPITDHDEMEHAR